MRFLKVFPLHYLLKIYKIFSIGWVQLEVIAALSIAILVHPELKLEVHLGEKKKQVEVENQAVTPGSNT
jgi:hypothetical protein